MNLPLTPRALSFASQLGRRTNRALNYSSGGGGAAPPSKVLPTVLLLGGGGAAGLGAYYYTDPNAEIFKQARNALGLEGPAQSVPKQNVVPDKGFIKKHPTQAPVVKEEQKKQPVKVEAPKSAAASPQITVPAPTPPPVKVPAPSAAAAASVASTAAAAVIAPAIVPASAKSKEDSPVTVAASASASSASGGGDSVPKHVLITALRAQQEALSETNEAKIKVIQSEYDRRLENAAQVIEAERVVELRAKYEKASAALQAIEQGIEARTTQNLRAKRLRALWAQVNALHARVNHPEYHSDTTTKIDKARLITAIEVPDEFVKQMVSSLPNSPVHSMESLKQRFYDQLEPVAKSVTLIKDGERFSVWKYAVGKLFGNALAKVQRGEPLGSESSSQVQQTALALDTARTALEKSDLLSAAIAINQLRGLPRQVASDWLSDARTLLETNQTLFVLMTYAASNNVF